MAEHIASLWTTLARVPKVPPAGSSALAFAAPYVVPGGAAATGRMLEKYDVEEQRPGGGGEYPTQDGFGWTNGVTRALVARGARNQDAACSNS